MRVTFDDMVCAEMRAQIEQWVQRHAFDIFVYVLQEAVSKLLLVASTFPDVDSATTSAADGY